MNRRTAREKGIQALYQMDLSGAEASEAIENVLNGDDSESSYLYDVVEGVERNLEEIDNTIKENLEKWSFDRLAKVDRNILRLAVYEMKQSEDVPAKVAINEAVELAKHFSDERASKFINGVLSKINKSME
ncbi:MULTISPECIES: transcription antitermination factor NusB [Bacillaceae]|uniref:Transcription antitermination protein NusB n=1 Tax=Domibacillus aminovorans TaxID=29332 RepID=A0A177KTQ7_9BACI|nr:MULTISPECIES: transcription antitermination factor NusB [Bacillaceae]OAH55981.1 N utilization substance protein B [Domibacillus aminovorans]OAH58141.1 N utilization substance protein B [Domibacillus aminovorans]